jgi:NitT/TauT family transport system ATP-binding protein
MLADLETPTTGRLLIHGEPPAALRTQHRLGVAFQDAALLPWRSVEANVRLPLEVGGLRVGPRVVADLIDLVGLRGFERARPHQLSGGMRQRVSIARALIHNPSVLMMDEPFGALDAITRTQIRHDLEILWLETAKTVVFITHSIEEAIGLSDRVLVMSPTPGRVVDEIRIELPRPRPAHLGDYPSFNAYADRIHDAFRRFGVIKY